MFSPCRRRFVTTRRARVSAIGLCVLAGLLSPVAAHAQTGIIAGTVIEDGTSTPLFGFGADACAVAIYSSTGAQIGTDETNVAGQFPLVFVRTNCRGEKQQLPVKVTIPTR